MHKIYIDTSDRFTSIVRLIECSTTNDAGRVVDEISGDIDVVTAIKTILEKHNLAVDKISKFEMNEGPGSFTGLRIGAAIVNALNFTLGKKDLKTVTPKYQPSKFDLENSLTHKGF